MLNSQSKNTLFSGFGVVSNEQDTSFENSQKRANLAIKEYKSRNKSSMEDYKHQPHYMYPSFKTVNTKNNLMNPGVHKLLTKMNHV